MEYYWCYLYSHFIIKDLPLDKLDKLIKDLLQHNSNFKYFNSTLVLLILNKPSIALSTKYFVIIYLFCMNYKINLAFSLQLTIYKNVNR